MAIFGAYLLIISGNAVDLLRVKDLPSISLLFEPIVPSIIMQQKIARNIEIEGAILTSAFPVELKDSSYAFPTYSWCMVEVF